MAVRSVQWEELERLELCKLWLGVESCWPCSRYSAELAGTRHGGRPRHGDADMQPVPDGDDEKGNLDNPDTQSSFDRSKAGFSSCKTSTSTKSTRDSAKVAHHGEAENGRNNDGDGESGRSCGKCKEESGPATGMASDVATLLDMLKPHLNALSVDAADLVARIEGDMKVTKTNEENIKEEKKLEAPGNQPAKLDKPMSDAQEIASQLQALEAMRMAEEEDEERLRRIKIEAGKNANTIPPSLSESLNNAANSIKEQRPEVQTTATASSSSV